MASFLDDISRLNPSALDGKTPPDSKFVDWLHGKASSDKRDDLHHKVGFGENDAASGRHNHDGQNSQPLWQDGEFDLSDLSGSATLADTIAKVNVILAAMREKSGAPAA